MIKMSPREFKHYLEKNNFSNITFRYDEQGWGDPYGVAPDFIATFHRMEMRICPTLLVLSNPDLHISLHGIDYIKVDPAYGRVSVHCNAILPECTPPDRTYTFLTSTN